MEGLQLRVMTPEDRDAFFRLFRPSDLNSFFNPERLPDTQEDLEAALEGKFGPLLAICVGTDVVGYIRIQQLKRGTGCASVEIYVSPERRRQGIGTAALRRGVQYLCQQQNLRRIEARAPQGSYPAQWLARFGFKQEVVRRKALYINGTWQDELIMAILWKGRQIP